MSAYTKVTVKGLEETLRELQKVEPEYVKDFRKKARLYAADGVKAAKLEFDHVQSGWSSDNPLPNMDQGALAKRGGREVIWDTGRARRGIKFKLGGPKKAARKHRTYRMFSIMQTDPAGALYDMAGKRKSNPAKNFEDTLEQSSDVMHRKPQPGYPNSGPSRYMWPGAWFYLPVLEAKIVDLVRELERKTNRKLIRKF